HGLRSGACTVDADDKIVTRADRTGSHSTRDYEDLGVAWVPFHPSFIRGGSCATIRIGQAATLEHVLRRRDAVDTDPTYLSEPGDAAAACYTVRASADRRLSGRHIPNRLDFGERQTAVPTPTRRERVGVGDAAPVIGRRRSRRLPADRCCGPLLLGQHQIRAGVWLRFEVRGGAIPQCLHCPCPSRIAFGVGLLVRPLRQAVSAKLFTAGGEWVEALRPICNDA